MRDGRPPLWWELAGRGVGVLLAVFVLPGVFPTDVGHFRAQADCIWRPTGKVLGMCTHKHWLVGGGGADLLNLPYRHLVYEFPPLPILTMPFAARFWGPLEVSMVVFGVAMASVEFGSLVYLRRSYPEHAAALTRWWTGIVAPGALIAWFRLDFLAVACATVGLVALERQRRTTLPVVLGWLAKLWPVVLLGALVAQRRWRALASGVCGVVVATAVWYAWSPEGFRRFLDFRAGRGLEVESLLASVRLLGWRGPITFESGAYVIDAGGFTWVNNAMLVGLVLFGLVAVWRAWRPGADMVALTGALTVASMVFSRIISGQYVVWVVPFGALLAARGNRRVGWLAAATSLATFAYLCTFDSWVVTGNRLAGSLVLLRNLLLLALLVELFRAIRPPAGTKSNECSTPDVAGSLG